MEIDTFDNGPEVEAQSSSMPPSKTIHLGPLIMPEKPRAGHRFLQAKNFTAVINGYSLDLTNAIDCVFKYEIKFMGVKKDGKEKDLSRGPKNDVAITLRRCALWKIYQTLLHVHKGFFGCDVTRCYYDCGINFYSIDPLCSRDDGEQVFRLEMEMLPLEVRDFFPRMTSIVCRLFAVQDIKVRDVSPVFADLNERERSVVQFLEIATTQMLLKDQKRWIFGNKSYVPPAHVDRRAQLGGGKILVSGMQKNVRFVGNNFSEAAPMAQIDAKKSPFFEGRNLVELVRELINNKPYREINHDERLRRTVARQLKELVVRTTHDERYSRHFSIAAITKETVEEVGFEYEGQRISVARYFLDKYQLRLRFPELPCVIERKYSSVNKRVENSFYPMEILVVCEGQRVNVAKQTPDLVEKMIFGCRLLPNELLDENEKQRQLAKVDSKNPYLVNLGIKVADKPSNVEAKVIYPPSIVYRNGEVQPRVSGELDWRLSVPFGTKPRTFILPAKKPRKWVVAVFEEAVQSDKCEVFADLFTRHAAKHGLDLGRRARIDFLDRKDLQAVREFMQKMHKFYVDYVLFISRSKRDLVHDKMKLAEAECKVVTQNVSAEIVDKALSNRGAEMTLDNLVMKLNLKIGGVNHSLGAAAAFLQKSRIANKKFIEESWLRSTRMFIGLDMSHPAPQPLYERLSGQAPGDPTVVGMAYTLGHCVKMKGEYWLQKARKIVIEDLEAHMLKALESFRVESGIKSYPEHVIVYRGGVSEGEYKKILTEEVVALREAFKKVSAEGKSGRIRLSVIVVQLNSNYRVFPLSERIRQQSDFGEPAGSGRRRGGGGNAATQNVPPGTCIDSDVIHPTHTEFLLVPHKSIAGTARPIRCTVLVDDEPRMSMDELETVTNMLCYAHGIVTSPVSVPAQLYAASDLAKRGRNMWKVANYGDDEAALMADDPEAPCFADEVRGALNNDGTDECMKEISKRLAPTCRHKFWA